MKLNISDRIYVTLMGLLVSYASLMYALFGTRPYAVYFMMTVVLTSIMTLLLYRSRIYQVLFKNVRETHKHPDLSDDIDLL